MQQKFKWDEKIGIALTVISVVFLGISIFLCFSNDIWYDELFTMGLANQSLSGLVSVTARDVHPPLYYVIVKLMLLIGEGLFQGGSQVVLAKLASVIPFLLCLFYGLTKVRKHFGWFSAGLFLFLLLSMPQLPDYTVEIRMYGYALFFITAAMLHGYEIMLSLQEEKHRKEYYFNWAAIAFYSLAACYTHYFACVAACMIYGYLLICIIWQRQTKQEIKAWFVSGAGCGLLYLPWLIGVVTAQVGAVKENYWIQPLSLRSLGGCIKFLFMPGFGGETAGILAAVLLCGAYGIVLFLGFHHILNRFEEQERGKVSFSVGCIGVLAGIILFGFAASFLIRPIFVYRYMLPAMGIFWLAFAVLLEKQKKRNYLFLPVLILAVLTGLGNYRAFYGEEMWKKVQMVSAVQGLEQIEQEDRVVYNFDQAQAVISFYLPNESYLWYGEPEALIREMYPANQPLTTGEFSDEKGMQRIKEWLSAGETVWFLGSGNAREEIRSKWEKEGISSEETASVMIERYWFNIYKLFLSND